MWGSKQSRLDRRSGMLHGCWRCWGRCGVVWWDVLGSVGCVLGVSVPADLRLVGPVDVARRDVVCPLTPGRKLEEPPGVPFKDTGHASSALARGRGFGRVEGNWKGWGFLGAPCVIDACHGAHYASSLPCPPATRCVRRSKQPVQSPRWTAPCGAPPLASRGQGEHALRVLELLPDAGDPRQRFDEVAVSLSMTVWQASRSACW